jgi:hypothetical protein
LAWLKYIINVRFPLLFAVLAVWYIDPTTSGGIIVIGVTVLAACACVAQLFRCLFSDRKAGLVIPDEQKHLPDNDDSDD